MCLRLSWNWKELQLQDSKKSVKWTKTGLKMTPKIFPMAKRHHKFRFYRYYLVLFQQLVWGKLNCVWVFDDCRVIHERIVSWNLISNLRREIKLKKLLQYLRKFWLSSTTNISCIVLITSLSEYLIFPIAWHDTWRNYDLFQGSHGSSSLSGDGIICYWPRNPSVCACSYG